MTHTWRVGAAALLWFAPGYRGYRHGDYTQPTGTAFKATRYCRRLAAIAYVGYGLAPVNKGYRGAVPIGSG